MRRIAPINSLRDEIHIVTVAAFSFSIVSWFATAQGLYEYVFIDQHWQALMLSFAIQSILFVLNLRLPQYFNLVGLKISPVRNQCEKHNVDVEKIFIWKLLRKALLGLSKLLRKVIVSIFYILILVSSSLFSFVYMTNLVYKNTQYIDANVALDRSYRMYLSEIDTYSNELTKLSQLTINSKLSELQTLVHDHTNSQESKSDLENALIKKREEYNVKLAEQKTSQSKFDTAKGIYETPMGVRWRDAQTYANEKLEYDTALIELENANKALATAKSELDKVQWELNNYKPTLNTTVHDLLVETLNSEPDIDTLELLLKNLNDMVIEIGENETSAEEFSQIVTNTKELSIAIDNYRVLREVQSQNGSNNDIKDFKNQLLEDEIVVPVPSSENFVNDKAQWETKWKERFLLLSNVIKSVPQYSESTANGIDGISEIVDIQSLKEFKPQEAANDIDVIVRENLANINPLERAFKLLHSDFPFLARFSFLMAPFLDISSLLAGLFIYYTSQSYGIQKQN